MRPDGFLDPHNPAFEAWVAGQLRDGAEAPYASLVAAVEAGLCRVAIIGPGPRLPRLKASYSDPRPHLVILRGADAGRTGPSGFPMAGAVLRWAYRSVIRLAEPAAEQYGAVLDCARRFQRVVVVETTEANAASWAEAIATAASPRDPNIAVIRPGEPVNLMPARKRRTRG
jgi:hypothetical protein